MAPVGTGKPTRSTPSRFGVLRILFNAESTWLALFIPALVSYLVLLHSRVQARPSLGTIERLDPRLDSLIPRGATLELLADGFLWTEGPLWFHEEDRSFLIFSDTKKNKIYRWEEGSGFVPVGKSLFMDKSGCRSNETQCSSLIEPGSNGLALQPGTDLLVLCQHGERRVVRREKNGTSFTPLATHFQGRRLNSPNDLIFSPAGHLYFTDPPYGLNGKEEDPARELNVSGVFRVPAESLANQTTLSTNGSSDVELFYGGLKRPNGLAFTPDKKLIVSNSDVDNPGWMVFDVDEDSRPINATEGTWVSARPFQLNGTRIGNPDGLKVDSEGNIFSAGPGGVLIFSSDWTHLGTLLTGKKTANVAFGGDGHLYVCASDSLARIPVLTTANK